MARCSICYTVIAEGEAPKSCPDCQVEYHLSCWDEIGGCGSYGWPPRRGRFAAMPIAALRHPTYSLPRPSRTGHRVMG